MNKPTLSKLICILFVFCAATAIASPAQVLTTLHSFASSPSDGRNPYAGLIQASDGNLYGTTVDGGATDYGTVFKITPSGTLTTLYSFCYQTSCANGNTPYSGLIQGSDGNFYGTTTYDSSDDGGQKGTIFRITPSGAHTTLYHFCSLAGCSDGALPNELVQGGDGNFYGTTEFGGAGHCAAGCGTVFKITPSGTLTTLHVFAGSDGSGPFAGLVQATDGNFYGTTGGGGASGNCSNGCGTVFQITPSGTLTTLYSFCSQANCADGVGPIGLVQASDGNFYGTTASGGNGGIYGLGTVFKITPSGALTTLYSFCSQAGCPDGAAPLAGVIQARDGNFYGTTSEGGPGHCGGGCGTAFKITPSGVLTTLYSFDISDGDYPVGGLIQARDGNFYGTTSSLGPNGYGTVFRLVLPRPCIVCPSVE